MGHQAGGKHEFAEGAAMPQEDRSHCWDGDFTQSFQEVVCLAGTLACVSLEGGVVTNWAAQQRNVPLGLKAKFRWGSRVGDTSSVAKSHDLER